MREREREEFVVDCPSCSGPFSLTSCPLLVVPLHSSSLSSTSLVRSIIMDVVDSFNVQSSPSTFPHSFGVEKVSSPSVEQGREFVSHSLPLFLSFFSPFSLPLPFKRSFLRLSFLPLRLLLFAITPRGLIPFSIAKVPCRDGSDSSS